MRPTAFLRIGMCLCLALILGGTAFAQTTGSIRGEVKDPSGAVVPGAKITATLLGTQTSRTVTAENDGSYEIPELAVGQYSLTVEAPGFKKFTVKDAEVTLGHVTVVNAALQVGGATETVTVEAEAAQVETSNTQLGAVVNDIAVTQLPLNQRSTYQLLELQPGVMSPFSGNNNTIFYGSNSAGAVSVNGGRERANNFMVNGGDANDIFVNLPGIQPSPDSIQEFRVLTNTYDAEYGRNSGSIVNVVTKSGTNEFHGDVYEFFRNKVLNARNFFDLTKADFKQNQFGGTLGGPIKKDNTFFFGSYEGFRLRQGISSGEVFVPTAAERAGNFGAFTGALTDANFASVLAARTTGSSTGTTCQQAVTAAGGGAITAGATYSSIFPAGIVPKECFDPTALDLMNQFVPLPNSPSLGSNVFVSNPVQPQRTDQFTIRGDQKLTSHQQLSGYYYFNDENLTQPFSFFEAAGANVPGFAANYTTRYQQTNISHTWTIGSSSVNEFRFAYFREGQQHFNHPVRTNLLQDSCKTVPAADCFSSPANPKLGITPNLGPQREGVPFVSVSGGFIIGNTFEGELPQIGNAFQWSDNFSKVVGKHTLKFGGEARYQRFDQTLFFDVNGEFGFSGLSPNALGGPDLFSDYLVGVPDLFGQGSAQVELVRTKALYLFAQDSWKLRPSLTLNYGLRWELTSPITDVSQHVQTFRAGEKDTVYPCVIGPNGAALIGVKPGTSCSPGGAAESVFPLGEVVHGDPGVPLGLTQTYYKGFAPRIGLAWSPGWTQGWLAKLTGGPGKSSVRMGYGISYNPVEQLVLEQFSAEPPFGGSTFISNTLFNTPYELQSGGAVPNPFNGILNPTPSSKVDWSTFRPILLFGEFQPHMRPQYSEQYNLTIQRELAKNLIFQIGYVGSQAHRLLATHDLNFSNPLTCQDLTNLGQFCAEFSEDAPFSVTVPPGQVFHLPYASPTTPNGPNIPCPLVGAPPACTVIGAPVTGTPITLVGLRPFSSPFCDPRTGNNCPPDGVPVFSDVFAQDTIGNSNYNSLQVMAEQRMAHGLQFQAAYTFSRSIDNASSFEESLNPLNFRRSRALSLFDARHRFVFSYVWDLPIPKHQGFAGKVLNGWGLTGIVTYQTGFPIRIFDGNDTEALNSFDFEPGGAPFIHGAFQTMDPRSNANHTAFNPNVFSDPTITNPNCLPGVGDPCFVIGNSPRALCCGPNLHQWDLAVHKTTAISERLKTEFHAEFFNAWNHTQFLNPDGNFTDGAPPSGTFGVVTSARNPRLIQFALKLLF